ISTPREVRVAARLSAKPTAKWPRNIRVGGVYSASMRAAWRTFFAAVLCFCAIASHAAPDMFTVGVLRRDGIVVPFAAYDGKQWRNRWLTPGADVDVPIDLRNVPSRWWGPL